MSDLRITICQQPLVWEDRATNRNFWESKLQPLKETTDLVVLPEMFTTGFSMNVAAMAEKMDGTTVLWLRNLSEKIGASITGSIIIEQDGKYYNRMLWAHPDKTLAWYDKRHRFSFANEDQFFTAGTERKMIEKNGWKLLAQVCYDLRFPVFSRNSNTNRYDVAVYVANWPTARSAAWRSLLVARAHENQCYVVGVNRVGTDGKGIEYDGSSLVVSPKGEILCSFKPNQAAIKTLALSKTALADFRTKFRPLDDADEFELLI